jgi:competence protein ComEA
MEPRLASPLAAVASVVTLPALVALARPLEAPAGPSPPAADAGLRIVEATPDAGPPESEAARALREGRPIDLNGASAEDLQLLPGIGPALAGRIASWREAHGPFRAVDELAVVRGIGRRTVERLQPLLEVRTAPDEDP